MSRATAVALGAIAALAFTVCTAAADGSRRSLKDSPSSSWTGFYVGASIGSAEQTAAWTVPGVVTTPSGDNRDGIYGAAIGYNYQMGSWLVVGVEGDWSKLEGEVRPIPACGGPCSTGAEWLATVRARAGVLLAPNYLLYATGGFAWADVHNSVTVASVDDSTTGWVYGVGLELRIDRSWSLKAEYLRVELDDTLACRVGPCGAANFATNHSLDIIRGGLNFKF